MLKIGFIGAGTVGTALAVKLTEKGYTVTAVNSRTRASAERLAQRVGRCTVYATTQEVANDSDLVFITTPDAAIPEVAAQVKWRKGQSVAHCSGADSTASLEAARLAGAMVGGFHPLQTFAGIDQAIENLPGSTFALEAVDPLLATLKKMAVNMDCYWIVLKASDKVLYHAAAVMACNYMVTLVKLSSDLWKSFNVPPEEATRALLPLIRGTVNNLTDVGIPQALTGPIARGDSGTVKKHLEALKQFAPDVVSTYQELGEKTVPIALAKGKINSEQASQIYSLFGLTEKLNQSGGA